MKPIAIGFLASTLIAASAFAGAPDVSKDKNPVAPEIPCFKDQEFQIDIFGTYLNLSNDQFHHDGRNSGRHGGGGGVGANYFFIRYLGVGIDGDVTSNRGGLWDFTGKLIARYPIEMGHFCIAPYAFAGGGLQTDGATVGAWMVGGGLEWRANPRLGIFAEGRYTWTGGSEHEGGGREGDNAQARLGLRIAF